MARSLKSIAIIVTFGTLLSKAGGLIRQLVIAAAFGVGSAYDAYNYAYVIPGFLLVLLGGINGPFHSAMVSVLSQKQKEERAYLLSNLNTIVSTFLILISGLLIAIANPLINLIAPGLNAETHHIAVIQLQLMAPIAFFAGLIGLGFGALTASNEFWVPSIAPLLSSSTVITGVILLWTKVGTSIRSAEISLIAGIVLAISTLLGALLQWLIQIPPLIKQKLASKKLIWDFKNPGVLEILKIMWPATLSSGMLQINVFTDLFFASGIEGAAAGLGYATLLVQTPLGLISNALLVPLLPTFSRLKDPQNKSKLINRIRQGLIFSTASMVPIGAIFFTLGSPIVTVIYQRGAFNSQATGLVTGILMAYGIGMPFYLGRDLLVRVFYALGDGETPFRLSAIGIGLNILFDWLLLGGPSPWGQQLPFNFGAPGIVLATAAINVITCGTLLICLEKNLGGLPLKEWGSDISKLFVAGAVSCLLIWEIQSGIEWPTSLIGNVLEIAISAAPGFVLFGLISNALGVYEVQQLFKALKKSLFF